jgi:hypothetical protein
MRVPALGGAVPFFLCTSGSKGFDHPHACGSIESARAVGARIGRAERDKQRMNQPRSGRLLPGRGQGNEHAETEGTRGFDQIERRLKGVKIHRERCQGVSVYEYPIRKAI